MRLPATRLDSLDAFRGLTIALMIVVNDPGSWSHVYAPLLHASWHGATPTDFVFPWFLFVVGVSIVLAYSKKIVAGDERGAMLRKIVRRSILIFALGIWLALWPRFNFDSVRIAGVLQRISIVFLCCSLLFLYTSWRWQVVLGAVLLVGYWIALAVIPVPVDAVIQTALETGEIMSRDGLLAVDPVLTAGGTHIAANLEQGTNLAAFVDRLVVPGPLYQRTWDPEGALSTLPAIASGITGMLVGHLLIADLDLRKMLANLVVAGIAAVAVAAIWNTTFPYNKNLWTSSFVLLTSGCGAVILGAMYWLIDLREWSFGVKPLKVFGTNAITAYVFHSMAFILVQLPVWRELGLRGNFMELLDGTGLPVKTASLLWALIYTASCYLPVLWLYRRRIFLKV